MRPPTPEESEHVQNHTTLWAMMLGNEAALAAARSFCHAEWMMFVQGLINADETVQKVVHAQIHAVLTHREDREQEFVHVAQQPAAVATAPSVEEVEKTAELTDEGKLLLITIQSIMDAEKACGEPNPHFQNAIQKLQESTEPLARGAAEALRLVEQALSEYSRAKPIKEAVNHVRDMVVRRCRACCVDPKDRDGFLVKVDEAFGGDLDKTSRAAVLLAYHKDSQNQRCGFVSNNAVFAARRGGPRPRRRRHPSRDHQEAGAGPDPGCKSDDEESDIVLESRELLCSSSCAAACEGFMWLEVPSPHEYEMYQAI